MEKFVFLLLLIGLSVGNEVYVFKGNTYSGWYPPDPTIAVGHTRILTAVNGLVTLFDKETRTQIQHRTLNNLFCCGTVSFDPRAVYDHYTNTFMLATANGFKSSESYIKIALAKEEGFDGLTGMYWNMHEIFVNVPGAWCDFPILGFDSKNIYITCNLFSDSYGYHSTYAWIVSKEDFYTVKRQLALLGMCAPLNWDADGEEDAYYFIRNANHYQLQMQKYDISTGIIEPVKFLMIPETTYWHFIQDADQLGGTSKIQTNSATLGGGCQIIGNKLYTSRTFYNTDDKRTGMIWYKIDLKTETIESYGSVYDGENWYYFPTIAVNELGTMGYGVIRSSNEEYASLYYGHKMIDGSITEPVLGKAGLSYYVKSRYGDYSTMALDPSDKLRFWVSGEIPIDRNSWEAYVVSFCPDCGNNCTVDCGPNGVCMGGVCDCIVGWAGELCDVCAEGYEGPDCLMCPDCGLNGICVNGSCVCDEGFSGVNCQECSICCGLHGDWDGTMCICDMGWDGESCDRCAEGHYGPDCSICSICDFHGTCVGDVCVCDEGWSGIHCDTCADEYYGVDCLPCPVCVHGECDTMELLCDCDIGWSGPECDDCDEHFWGDDCLPCLDCGPHGICDEGLNGTGVCICDARYTGEFCDRCADGYYGAECQPCPECGRGGECVEGKCVCFEGWIGAHCGKCDIGYFGPNCRDCSQCLYGNCTNNTCLCDEGWDGVLCNFCHNGSFLACSFHGECEDGECSCDEGWFGPRCLGCTDDNDHPDCNCNDKCGMHGQCIDGHCVCDVGWLGTLCDECQPGNIDPTCPVLDCGEYGENDGPNKCVCQEGFVGRLCQYCIDWIPNPQCST